MPTPQKKRTAWNKGKSMWSDEQKAQMSATRKGKPNPKNSHPKSEETKMRLSAAHLGLPAWNKGIPMPEEQKSHLSVVKTGIKASDATRTQMSESHKARYANGYTTSEKCRKQTSIARKGSKHTPEAIAKMSKARASQPPPRLGVPQSPETVKRMSEISRQYWENMTDEQKIAKLEILRASTKDITRSSLEEVIAAELDAQGIIYERQKRIGWYCVDFFIPEQFLIIEGHGCFWHACEQCGEEQHKEKRLADAKRYEYLQRKGYQLKIIWEHERAVELQRLYRARNKAKKRE